MSSMLTQVLCVAEDFDGFGGASQELVAWELGIEPETIKAAWDQAIDQSLLMTAPRDQIFDEEMFRLTELGRVWLAADPSRLVPSTQTVYEVTAPRPTEDVFPPELAPSLAE